MSRQALQGPWVMPLTADATLANQQQLPQGHEDILDKCGIMQLTGVRLSGF